MKKAIVLGILVAMVMGLSVAANATFVKDTDWAVYIQAGNNTYATSNQNWGSAGTEVKLGDATAPAQTAGSAMSSTVTAYVRDMSGGGANGYVVDTQTAVNQTSAAQVQTWDNISVFAGSGYSATTLSLRIWTIGIDANGPAIKLEVVKADGGATATGFSVGQVLLDSTTASPALTTDTAKKTPWTTINLYPYLAGLKASDGGSAHLVLKLTATTPAQQTVVTPEPGSMLAMFSGLVGLVGFGIRRRK